MRKKNGNSNIVFNPIKWNIKFLFQVFFVWQHCSSVLRLWMPGQYRTKTQKEKNIYILYISYGNKHWRTGYSSKSHSHVHAMCFPLFSQFFFFFFILFTVLDYACGFNVCLYSYIYMHVFSSLVIFASHFFPFQVLQPFVYPTPGCTIPVRACTSKNIYI